MSDKPVMHGRDHRPGGEDPITDDNAIRFDTDNEGGSLFVRSNGPISGIDPNYDGKGIALVDGEANGIVIDSDQDVGINTVQNGSVTIGQPGNSQEIALNGIVTLAGTFDAGGARITNGADGVDPTDFATVEQVDAVAGSGVTSLDSITGAVTLVSGSNVTITPNSPGPGDITISATGSGGGALPGNSSLVYRHTVTGSDKASIDTGVDTPDAGSNDWTNGDLLEVVIVARTDKATVFDALDVTVNNDTAAHYDRENNEIVNVTHGGGPDSGATAWHPNVTGANAGASYPGMVKMSLPDYAGTAFFKVGESRSNIPNQTDADNLIDVEAWGYRSTSAITRLKVAAQGSQKLKVGSQLLIYKRLAS